MQAIINEALENLIKDFSIKNLQEFISLKRNDAHLDNINIPNDTKFQDFDNIVYVSKFNLPDAKEFQVFAIKTNFELSERSSKKKQFELAKTILKNGFIDAGFFVFYDDNKNFRFSLVFRTYDINKTEFSYYKRYTYYVQRDKLNKTFRKQLSEAKFDTLKNIINAFSIQPLTKEFYTEIEYWYAWALESNDVQFGNNSRKEENLIRLITRLIFVWFLKQKGLVNEVLFDDNELSKIVKDFKKGNYYYNVILQNLFFATLNRPIKERGWAQDKGYPINKSNFGVRNLFRYEKFLNIDIQEFMKLYEDIPFVNGGLFECLDREVIKEDGSKDYVFIDGFTRRENDRAKIADEFFFSDYKLIRIKSFYEKPREVKVRGIINILKDYNWTVDENSVMDIDVALDPELLGHIFENLLASYNEETKSTARKSTGSYYTPKEIVDFMVEESIIEYLKTNTRIEEERIKKLVYLNDTENIESLFSKEERKEIVEAIDKLKVLDPAVGSGAFPVGVLHKLVYILERIDSDNELWKDIQLEKAVKEIEEIKDIEDEKFKKERIKDIEEVFNEKLNYADFARKLYLIEDCIYGVDIQNIAIQICKLRFFLTLLIDQKVDRSKENLGIRPLPNFETKFVCANSLISLEKKSESIFITENLKKLKIELKELYKKYYNIKTRQEKVKIEKKSKEIKEKMKEELIKVGYSDQTIKKIMEFDVFDQLSSANWFDIEWMFGIDDKFDIVIANPPYVSTKGVDEKYKEILTKEFNFADDLYNHFYFKGIELIKDYGILAYISSKTFWTIQTKKNLRELLLKNRLIKIVDTANPFENVVVDTCIVIVQKLPKNFNNNNKYFIDFIDVRDGWNNRKEYKVNIEVYKNVVNNVFFLPTDFNLKIYEKIAKHVKILIDEYWDKISTSKNIEKYKRELDKYRKNLKPGDITILGLITEGGQGLATGDNGKYVGVLEGTKWAEKVRTERPEKLLLATEFCKKYKITNKLEAKKFLDNLTEIEIRELFDNIKKEYGRDIFGRGWLYRIVSYEEIADVDSLTEYEKLNGIKGKRTFVPYDKGDKEGNRWYAPTPYYIDWSIENVSFLKKNSGKKGEGMPVVRNQQFYFKEGFCWNNVTGDKIICRIKEKTVHSTEAMTFTSIIPELVPDYFLVCLLNSSLLANYKNTFLNVTVHLTTGDAKEFPIVIPNDNQLKEFEDIFNRAVSIQKQKFLGKITDKQAQQKLELIQIELDQKVLELYQIL
ncbi:MAG: Eco57I restriction-modification methylase domain-containing protein [bacterium]